MSIRGFNCEHAHRTPSTSWGGDAERIKRRRPSELAKQTTTSFLVIYLMARREGVSLLLVSLAAAVFVSCDATICVMCTCSSTGGATKSVSCTHMSMDMYRVPDDVPSTTELL